jgi:hypothetical protein
MLIVDFDLIFGVERHFQQYFSYVMTTSFSDGRSRREPPIMDKQQKGPGWLNELGSLIT